MTQNSTLMTQTEQTEQTGAQMINPGRSYNVNDYKEIFLRRKLYFIIPFVLIFTAAILWAGFAPRKYQASTLVLVTPQRVPADLVRPTVTASIIERLNSISQEIMSRTRLEQIIDELKLYQGELKPMKREEVVELMRKNIKVELPKRIGNGRLLHHQLHGRGSPDRHHRGQQALVALHRGEPEAARAAGRGHHRVSHQ